jgi:two-component system cell cycle sensor histidine kinase/response regulator CckA
MTHSDDQLVSRLKRENAELKAIVEQLQASEERWRTIVRTEPECVKIVSPTGELVEMNPAGLAMLDATSLGEVCVRPLLAWVEAEDRAAFADLHRRVMAGESGELEFGVVGAKGTRRRLQTHAAPLRDRQGTIVSLLAISRDVTRQRLLEEQLRQSQKMDAIGQLAGGIAHDFNNLLTVIQGFSLMLLDETRTSGEGVAAARQIVQAAERAASLTRQLLAFGRRQVMQPRLVDLNALVANLLTMVQRILGEDLSLQLQLSPQPLTVLADTGMIDQVLLNLVVNARDAMPSGGRLVIETIERFVSDEEATTRPRAVTGRHACLRVIDTGSGIAHESLSHIFEPFFTTKDPGKGTGLGLATAFGIVSQHGGFIRVNSTLAVGSTFEVLLPMVDAPPVEKAVEGATPELSCGTETILVVEDEPAVRMLTRVVLERQGYRVIEAESGVDALRAWDEHAGQVDLVLTDMIMPGSVSGRQLAERLRAMRPDVRIVFTSGYSPDFTSREQSLVEGQNFIQKPCAPKQMLQVIRLALSDERRPS